MHFQRYVTLAEETDRALSVLSQQLAASGPRLGDDGG
jgi:two-component system, chemotaxis family, protein-glutamate methylesterase/glutaminase